jgi:hypothetical protein
MSRGDSKPEWPLFKMYVTRVLNPELPDAHEISLRDYRQHGVKRCGARHGLVRAESIVACACLAATGYAPRMRPPLT